MYVSSICLVDDRSPFRSITSRLIYVSCSLQIQPFCLVSLGLTFFQKKKNRVLRGIIYGLIFFSVGRIDLEYLQGRSYSSIWFEKNHFYFREILHLHFPKNFSRVIKSPRFLTKNFFPTGFHAQNFSLGFFPRIFLRISFTEIYSQSFSSRIFGRNFSPQFLVQNFFSKNFFQNFLPDEWKSIFKSRECKKLRKPESFQNHGFYIFWSCSAYAEKTNKNLLFLGQMYPAVISDIALATNEPNAVSFIFF